MTDPEEITIKPGLRAAQFTKCAGCGKGVGSSIYFYRATIEHHVLGSAHPPVMLTVGEAP